VFVLPGGGKTGEEKVVPGRNKKRKCETRVWSRGKKKRIKGGSGMGQAKEFRKSDQEEEKGKQPLGEWSGKRDSKEK